MGIFVGWILQKRWMTLAAFLLTVAGSLTLPGLPSPFRYAVALPPVLLVMAVIYERFSLPGLNLGPRLRLALTFWMGLCVLVLMVGIMWGGSTTLSIGAGVLAFAMVAVGLITIRVMYRQQTRAPQASSPDHHGSDG